LNALRVLAQGNAAEQIVGPERRQRLSHQTWCGEDWMVTRRPVNSTVMLLSSNRWALAVILFSWLVFTSACIMGDGGTSTHGRVLDERGKPIKGALVTLVSRGRKAERVSSDDGSYDVGVIHAPVKPMGKLTASKAGYEPYEKTFSSREELGPPLDIVLKETVAPAAAP
jgi:hypothetical protein